MTRVPNKTDFSKWRAAQRKKGVEVDMTAEEWVGWWFITGQYHNRGNYKTNVNMARIDIKKPFDLTNIRLVSASVAHAHNH